MMGPAAMGCVTHLFVVINGFMEQCMLWHVVACSHVAHTGREQRPAAMTCSMSYVCKHHLHTLPKSSHNSSHVNVQCTSFMAFVSLYRVVCGDTIGIYRNECDINCACCVTSAASNACPAAVSHSACDGA